MNDVEQMSQRTRDYVNVADARLGARVLSVTDDFFGAKERMLQASDPEWRAGVYDDHGKWMDGWESRRRRDGGHDFAVVRLAAPSTLSMLEIDTRYFTGNYPPHAAVEACFAEGDPDERTQWQPLLSRSGLRGNDRNYFELDSTTVWTHLRLNIYPDGGIARLRALGIVRFDWGRVPASMPIDLLAAVHGGRALACNDEHYGAMGNVLLPGRGSSMADGCETRRRRTPGHDWVILQLGHIGQVHQVEIDTAHFKGNYPHQVSVHGALLRSAPADLVSDSEGWPALLTRQYLQADQIQRFDVTTSPAISHVRVNIYPDGGLSRVRLIGHPARDT